VKLLYFAWVRQNVGKSEEDLALPADVSTLRDLARHLRTRGPGYAEAFADLARLRAAANQVHVGFDTQLSDGDEIAFFPPVTGG
jgi:molybdopterin synthase sulfur carrier subunit